MSYLTESWYKVKLLSLYSRTILHFSSYGNNFFCSHEALDLQYLGVYNSLTIRKECDDLNGTFEIRNGPIRLGIQSQLRITFLLNCNYVSFEPLSCVQLSGFTSDPSPDPNRLSPVRPHLFIQHIIAVSQIL